MQEHLPVSPMYSRPDEFLRSWARFTRGESAEYPVTQPPTFSETLHEATHALTHIFGVDDDDFEDLIDRLDEGRAPDLDDDGFTRAMRWSERFLAEHVSAKMINWALLNWIFSPGDTRFIVARVDRLYSPGQVVAVDLHSGDGEYPDYLVAPLRGLVSDLRIEASIKYIDYARAENGHPLAPGWSEFSLSRFQLMCHDSHAGVDNAYSCGARPGLRNLFQTAYRFGYLYDFESELKQAVESLWGRRPFPLAAVAAVYTARRVLGAALGGANGPLSRVIRRGQQVGVDAVQ